LSFAIYIGSGFNPQNLKILEELDIDSSFITDYRLQEYYKKFSKSHKYTFANQLNDASLFIPQIKQILKENDIPSAFLYLVMAESYFTLDAKSHKKAKGLWQFLPSTAKRFGLEIDEYIDERMDIIKSTKAAVKYLKYLHKMFGKWYLAAIAYNCGEARVIEGITRASLDMCCNKHIKKCRKNQKIKQYRHIIRLYQQKKLKYNKLYQVYKDIKKLGYKPDIDQLLILQKNIKRQYIPNESRDYIRKIISLAMMNNSDILLKDENLHLLNRGICSPIAKIEVKGGILLKNIAKVLGITKKKLLELNPFIKRGITPPYKKKYHLYIPYSQLVRFNLNKDKIKTDIYDYYIVKKGDSLYKIAKKYKIKYKSIKRVNKLTSNILHIGQMLHIPLDEDMLLPEPLIYVVQHGDSLIKIAKKYKISLQQLKQDNQIKSNLIHVGDKLVIKNY
jgi:membrane-bound lytic murein transglycosylase D